MKTAEHFLENKLNERIENGLLRKLHPPSSLIDFCSNDYLGFARSTELKELINQEIEKLVDYKNGSTGSRLITGNHPYIEQIENLISNFHNAPAGLIFNSGYDANIGLLSSIPQRGDTIITDELIHASLIDGARLSHAERYKFKHNDLDDLESKLKIAKGIIYVVVESVYSMDGDLAPLAETSKLCKKYNANLIVDEAHATGIFGENGKGLINHFALEDDIFARIITFGKAIGVHGAIILGSKTLRDYLINFARSFIYTTAAPIHNIIAVNCAYKLLSKSDFTTQIKHKIDLYNELVRELNLPFIKSESTIQTILFSDNDSAKKAADQLLGKGFNVKAILSPTVAKGKERLRICLHIYNADEEIINLINELKILK